MKVDIRVIAVLMPKGNALNIAASPIPAVQRAMASRTLNDIMLNGVRVWVPQVNDSMVTPEDIKRALDWIHETDA